MKEKMKKHKVLSLSYEEDEFNAVKNYLKKVKGRYCSDSAYIKTLVFEDMIKNDVDNYEE